jgi:hypothetical protein
MTGVGTMAKKKAGAKPKGGAEPQEAKGGRPPLTITVQLKSTAEWKAWLVRVSQQRRIDPSATIDQALADWAANNGLEPPPPRK